MGLLDFLQAASNTAAQNVAGPIDLLSWALKSAGMPGQEKPMLGSEWMKEKGLMRDVPQSAASLAGETVGLLAPIGAVQFAPQIAAWRNMVNERLAPGAPGKIPTSIPRGAIVYHGSPHKFDKFDSTKIGTGEGAQSYGHGLYLADAPEVAKTYSQGSAPTLKHVTIDGKARIIDVPPVQGNLYKVDLPDEAIARMLDWDKPLSQQAPGVQKALSPFLQEREAELRRLWKNFSPQEVERELKASLGDRGAGQQIYEQIGYKLGNGDVGAGEYLRGLGIPGIRYLDGGSRAAGTGTSNYVVFPGEEGLLSILERNGIPLK